jgi:hypothetical protein
MTKTGLLILALLLCSCRDQRPPAPSAEQADRLNEAEAMLNNLATNEEGPADRSTGPSNQTD